MTRIRQQQNQMTLIQNPTIMCSHCEHVTIRDGSKKTPAGHCMHCGNELPPKTNLEVRREFAHQRLVGKLVRVIALGTGYRPDKDDDCISYLPLPEYGIALLISKGDSQK